MENWPPLSQASDGPTIATLHLVAQMIGKVPTALLPWRNHGWHLTLHLTPRGLATEPVHAGPRCFDLTLDLVEHRLVLGGADASGSRGPYSHEVSTEGFWPGGAGASGGGVFLLLR
jgi:hypothetical protein